MRSSVRWAFRRAGGFQAEAEDMTARAREAAADGEHMLAAGFYMEASGALRFVSLIRSARFQLGVVACVVEFVAVALVVVL